MRRNDKPVHIEKTRWKEKMKDSAEKKFGNIWTKLSENVEMQFPIDHSANKFCTACVQALTHPN